MVANIDPQVRLAGGVTYSVEGFGQAPSPSSCRMQLPQWPVRVASSNASRDNVNAQGRYICAYACGLFAKDAPGCLLIGESGGQEIRTIHNEVAIVLIISNSRHQDAADCSSTRCAAYTSIHSRKVEPLPMDEQKCTYSTTRCFWVVLQP